MWCGHAASALNPVIEAVTDNKCLDILAQSAGQCKCFLILFFAAQAILYIKYSLRFVSSWQAHIIPHISAKIKPIVILTIIFKPNVF